MLLSALLILAGFVLLLGGAELLVRSSSAIAQRLGVSPIVIGLTIVAFGTNAPELAVSIGSALRGYGDIAVGNVIGSNIINIALVLGLTMLIRPIAVTPQVVKFDMPIMIGSTILLLGFLSDRIIVRW